MLSPTRKTLAVSASSAALALCLRARAAAEGGFHGATLGHTLAVVALVVATGCGKPTPLALALLCLGRSTESRTTFLEVLPSSFSSNLTWLLAAWVTTPRRAAAWPAAASPLARSDKVSLEACNSLAATLASASTNRLDRQSMAVSLRPLLSLASPMVQSDWWAGIHARNSFFTRVAMSHPSVMPMAFQIRASGLEWWVALAVPDAAAESKAMQSVRS